MQKPSTLFTGIFGAFAVSCGAMVLIPYSQIGSLPPQVQWEEGKISPDDVYPQKRHLAGEVVYVEFGCFYCHTQQVRDPQYGPDLERGWGVRRTVARDYIYEKVPLLGNIRLGPDFANYGSPTWRNEHENDSKRPAKRDEQWVYRHLFNPKTFISDSKCPPYRSLFERKLIGEKPSPNAAAIDGAYEFLPTLEAEHLAKYLLSQDRSHELKEAPIVIKPKEAPEEMSNPNAGQDRIDYVENADITEIHASIAREHAEPRADVTPIPAWLSILCAAALCWAGAYIGIFHGGFNSKVYNEYESSPMAFFPLPKGAVAGGGEAAAELTPLALGAKVYKETCINCHQATGLGQPGAVPPLAGSEWVDGAEYNEKRLVAMVMKGLKGPVTVKGASYNSQMQNWQTLGDKKIAAVLTYIRQEWGNKGGEITEAQVAAAKKEFANHGDQWTIDEIKQIPLDAKLEGAAAPAPAQTKADAKPGDTKPAVSAPAPAATGTFDMQASIAGGKNIYMQTCFACHQATGMGLPGAFPPLVGTPYVHEDDRRLVAIVLKGIVGAMTVDGKIYATGMPNPMLTFPQLKDDKNVADVLNYVRNNFGNKNERAITPDFVAKVRAEFADREAQWTEAELLKFPPTK